MHGRIIRRAAAAAVAMLAFAGPAAAQTINQGPPGITTDATAGAAMVASTAASCTLRSVAIGDGRNNRSVDDPPSGTPSSRCRARNPAATDTTT